MVDDSDIFVDFDDLCNLLVLVVSPPPVICGDLLDNCIIELGDESSILQKDDFSTFIKSWGSLSVGSW